MYITRDEAIASLVVYKNELDGAHKESEEIKKWVAYLE